VSESKLKPIVFLAFANKYVGQDGYLRELGKENDQIREALEPVLNDYEILERATATFENIKKEFFKFKDRIAIFHYGGHATSDELMLESSEGQTLEAANAAGIAQFLAQPRDDLKLVFLNACSTQAHVQALHDARIPAVIATMRPVNDALARSFAQTFYQGLSAGLSVRTAFLKAQAAIQVGSADQTRHLGGSSEVEPSSADWLLSPDTENHPATSWTLPELARDPLFGLPDIPRTDLPAKPFRHLSWFRREDAEIFFGRGQYIRKMYERITGDGDPIILLYGQSGVGKSSLLDAGVRPRLEEKYEVKYVRRDKDLGLLGILYDFAPHQVTSLRNAWLELEERSNKPVIIILDQLEEVFTRPNANLPDELDVFLNAVQTLTGNPRPQGKLILGFRKEWLAEIERRLEAHGLPFVKRFLEPLDHDGVIDAIRGPSTSKRLIEKYGLEIHADLPEAIAQDMLEDRGSPVATTLQILLTRMFDEAIKTNKSKPRFDPELYGDLKRRGILLGDFLDQQLEQLTGTHPTESSSGLALDVLAYHTTALGTAEQRGASDLNLEYGNRDGLEGLLQALKDLYLLAEASGDGAMPEGGWPTRLSHDTLAPLVRKLFGESVLPGQLAKSTLANRAVEWAGERDGTPLDERDLEVVEHGEMGMRVLRMDEMRMLEVSRDERNIQQRLEAIRKRREQEANRGLRARALIAGVIAVAAVLVSVVAVLQFQQAQARGQQLLVRQLAAQGLSLVSRDTRLSLLLSIKSSQLEDSSVTRDAVLRGLQSAFPIRSILSGHKDGVSSVAFSPNGKTIASAGYDNTIRVWNSSNGHFIRELKGHTNWVNSVVFSPDSKIIASGSRDNTIRLWSSGSGRLIRIIKGHINWVNSVVFSPDSKIIASCGDDNAIQLWNSSNGVLIYKFFGHTTNSILDLAFSPDGKTIASAGTDKTIRLWDLSSKSIIKILKGHENYVNSIFFSPNGKTIASSSWDNTIRLWNLRDKSLIRVLKSREKTISSVIFSHDGRIIAASSDNGAIQFWKSTDGSFFRVLKGHNDAVSDLTFSPDDKTVASSSIDGTIRLWNIGSKNYISALKGHKGYVSSVKFNLNGRIIASASQDYTVRLWHSSDGSFFNALKGHEDIVSVIAFSPDGKTIASGSWDNTIRLWDSSNGRFIFKFLGYENIVNNAGEIIDLSSTIPNFGRNKVNSVVFNPNGKIIATSTNGGEIRLWNSSNRNLIYELKGHKSYVNEIVFSLNGEIIASASEDSTIRLWDSSNGRLIRTLIGHKGSVKSVGFSPNGKIVASASEDSTIRLWDSGNGRLIREFIGHTDWVNDTVFSPDGKTLASASRDKTIRLWDISTGQQIGDPLTNSLGAMYSVDFNPSGSILASGGSNGVVYLWDMRLDAWRARACRIANRNLSLEEWKQYIGESTSYEKVCPDLPPGEGAPADSK
jgi:WD40 repeat protein